MSKIMISCKEATELIEKRAVTKLSIIERVQLLSHTGMCSICTQFEKISRFLDLKLAEKDSLKEEKLPDSVKSDILKAISK